jgi:ribosomal protein L10
MNKSKLKKKIESNNFKKLIKECTFIGFFCIQNLATTDNIQFKKSLNKQGFKYVLIKNTLIFKSIFNFIPKMRVKFFGSIAICYSSTSDPKFLGDINFVALSEVFFLIGKEKNTFFLGGFFEGSLVNSLFERQVCALKTLNFVHLEYIFLMESFLNKIILTTSTPKNQLSLLLSNKAKY